MPFKNRLCAVTAQTRRSGDVQVSESLSSEPENPFWPVFYMPNRKGQM